MSTAAFLLVIGSALLHASWNLAIKTSRDHLVTAGAQVMVGALVFAPFLIVTGLPHGAWGWIALSSSLHLLYGLNLVAAYDRGDLSAVYPIARGTAPALVAVGAAVILGDRLGATEIVAIGLIVGGIIAIGAVGQPRGIGWAVVTGLFISSYTIIDGNAVRHLDGSIAYTTFVFMGNAMLYIPTMLIRRGRNNILATIGAEWWRHLLGGTASALAYILVLSAARLAPLGLVAAVRETGVAFGALAGWLLLHEQLGGRRVFAAIAIAFGLAFVAI